MALSALEQQTGIPTMRTNRFLGKATVCLLASVILLPTEAKAVSVEVAKKCNALLAKEFPPRQPGNPAAGSTKGGGGPAERDYFKKCVDNGGNVDSSPDKK